MLDGKTILLTGGTGSFGNAFCARIQQDHPTATVRIFSRDELKQSEMQPTSTRASSVSFWATFATVIGSIEQSRVPTSSSTPLR